MKLDDLQAETIEFTQALVQAYSPSGQEKSAADLLARKLKSLDFDDVRVDRWGSVRGIRKGSRPGKTILWDAHLDVVDPGNLEAWTEKPDSGEIKDGKVWGRGATDIKGGMAAMAVVAGRIPRDMIAGILMVTGSVGEEKIEGCGLKAVLEEIKPDAVVVCEPTGCQLAIGHKGRAGVWIETAGRAAHSSQPQSGENAIYKALEVVDRIRSLSMKNDPVLGQGVRELVEISSRPYPGESTIPYGCRLRYDCRLVRGETRSSVLDSFQTSLAGISGVTLGYHPVDLNFYTGERLQVPDFHPAWCMEPDHPLVNAAAAALNEAGLTADWTVAPFCTNGSLSAGELGIPTVVFGPSFIDLAHIVNEYVDVDQLKMAVKGLSGFAKVLGAF